MMIDSIILSNLGSVVAAIFSVVLGLFLTSDCDLYLRFCSYDEKNAFRGKVVWIIGASSGIGASLALDVAQASGQVVLSARREDLLKSVAEKCASIGGKATEPFVVTLDILDEKSVIAAHEKILARFGRVDVAVLNAGKGQRALVADTTVAVAEDLVRLNYLAFVGITRAILPDMLKRKAGHIVALSSMAGKIGTPISAAYSASKFAIHGYFDGLRAEVARDGVRVSLVCPGPVESEFYLRRVESGDVAPAKDTKKMATARCSRLIAKGIARGVDEMWISRQPVLLSVYLHTYAPWLSRQLFKNVLGPSRVKALRTGGDPYDALKLFGLKK